MFVRVQLLSITLIPYAARSLALAMVPAFIVGGLTTLLALRARNAEASASEVKLGNPLDFGPALLLAGLVAVMAIPARWALEQFGDQGIIVVLGLTGMWDVDAAVLTLRSEEHTSELQSLMRTSYAVFCLKKKNNIRHQHTE